MAFVYERRCTDNVNNLSSVGFDASFVDDRDAQFAGLLKSPGFWKVVLECYDRPQNVGGKILQKLCRVLATEGYVMFDLRYRRGFSVEQIVQYDREGVWTPEIVERFLALIQEAREAWDNGEIKFPPASCSPRIRALLDKARRGERLGEHERLILCASAIARYGLSISVDRVQASILNEELGGLSGDARRKKIRQILIDSMRLD